MITFNLKKEWFEKIKSGEKTHEYREIKDYWQSRLFRKERPYIFSCEKWIKDRDICFVCGYAKKDDKDKRLYAKILNINPVWGADTDLKIQKNVFDIEFVLIDKIYYEKEIKGCPKV